MTSFIQREIDRINDALQISPIGEEAKVRYREMWVAQQALVWALDPSNYRSPVDTIDNAPLQATTGLPA